MRSATKLTTAMTPNPLDSDPNVSLKNPNISVKSTGPRLARRLMKPRGRFKRLETSSLLVLEGWLEMEGSAADANKVGNVRVDGGDTLVVEVVENFAPEDQLILRRLSLKNFRNASPPTHLIFFIK